MGSPKLSRHWEEKVFWTLMTVGGIALTTVVLIYGRALAAELGFRSRVLHDVQSPDGQFRAICQEVPAFDGPEYQTRLHRADGTFVRNIAYGGDAQPCEALVWAADGKQLLVFGWMRKTALYVNLEDARRNRHITINYPSDVPPQFRSR